MSRGIKWRKKRKGLVRTRNKKGAGMESEKNKNVRKSRRKTEAIKRKSKKARKRQGKEVVLSFFRTWLRP